MESFRDFLSCCGLADLGYIWYTFTWDNKREGDKNIQVRLDRATCNSAFMSMYPETMVENLVTQEFDHMAILICVMETAAGTRLSVAHPSQFEEMWTRHEGYDWLIMHGRKVADCWVG